MKITKEQLKQIIKEELDAIMGEVDKRFIDPNNPEAVMRDRYMMDKLKQLRQKRKAKEEEAGMVKEEMSDEEWTQLLKDIREFAEGEANMVAHEPMGHHMVGEKIMKMYGDQLLKVVDEERMEDIAYNIAWKAAKGYDEY
jgi:uncharacterized protein YjgD (DUF1641 family)